MLAPFVGQVNRVTSHRHNFRFSRRRYVAEWSPVIGPEAANYRWLATACLAVQLPMQLAWIACFWFGIRDHLAVLDVAGAVLLAAAIYVIGPLNSRFARQAVTAETSPGTR